MICITCPQGCLLQVEKTDAGYSVSGNGCKRGIAFAEAEMTHPMRSVTGTVRTVFPQRPMLPVRTDREVPKEKMKAVARFMAEIVVEKAVACGEAVSGEIPGCGGAVLVATETI
jgi:CxxC motif-containing protein